MVQLRRIALLVLLCATPAAAQEAAQLTRALEAAGIPIDGVSLGDLKDRSTWRVDFKASATDDQRKQAGDVIAAFDPLAPAVREADLSAAATRAATDRQIRAFYLWFFRLQNRRDPTPQEKAAAIAALVQAFKDVGP